MLPLVILLLLNQRVSAAQDPKNFTAELGQDIILPCQVSDKNILAGVEWSRADLEPEYVLLLRDGHFVPQHQQPSFKGRVDLKERQMKDGDVSLILKKVTIDDTGTYECRILTQENKRRKRAVETVQVLNLRVVPPGHTGGATEDGGEEAGGEKIGSVGLIVGLAVFTVLIVSAVVGFVIYRKRKQQQSQDSYQPPPEQQPV